VEASRGSGGLGIRWSSVAADKSTASGGWGAACHARELKRFLVVFCVVRAWMSTTATWAKAEPTPHSGRVQPSCRTPGVGEKGREKEEEGGVMLGVFDPHGTQSLVAHYGTRVRELLRTCLRDKRRFQERSTGTDDLMGQAKCDVKCVKCDGLYLPIPRANGLYHSAHYRQWSRNHTHRHL